MGYGLCLPAADHEGCCGLSPMARAAALVLNASDFAGPPAVSALLGAGYRVFASDAVFADAARAEAFRAAHPGVEILGGSTPEEWVPRRGGSRACGCADSNDHFPPCRRPPRPPMSRPCAPRLKPGGCALPRNPCRDSADEGAGRRKHRDGHLLPHEAAHSRWRDPRCRARCGQCADAFAGHRTRAVRDRGERGCAEFPLQRGLLPPRDLHR